VNKTRICDKFREAQKALTEFKALRDAVDIPKVESRSLSDLLDRWLAHKASEIQPGTLAGYEYAVRHIKVGLGSVELEEIQPEAIDLFLRSKLKEISPRYVKLLRTVLSMSLDQAVRWKLLTSNPARYSASIKQSQAKGRSLSPDQAKALLAACEDDRLRALWILTLGTGLRRGEALGLEWEDYDERARTLSVTKARKKEGSKVVLGSLKTDSSRRVIPVPSFVCTALDRHRDEQVAEKEHLESLGVQWKEPTAMFATPWGHWLDPDGTSKAFKRLALKAGLGDWHMHELRHSAASLMLAQGVRLEEVSEIIGHASIRVTKDVYGHLSGERLREATDKMGEFLGDL